MNEMDKLVLQQLITKLVKLLIVCDKNCSGCKGSVETESGKLIYDFNFDITLKEDEEDKDDRT